MNKVYLIAISTQGYSASQKYTYYTVERSCVSLDGEKSDEPGKIQEGRCGKTTGDRATAAGLSAQSASSEAGDYLGACRADLRRRPIAGGIGWGCTNDPKSSLVD